MGLVDSSIRISVIIPTFNVEGVVNRCLESLLSQGLDNIEVLFIDDCSSDRTVSIIDSWIKERNSKETLYKIIRHKENQGVASARNTGLNNARGRYVYFLDSDDYLAPNSLRLLYETAEMERLEVVGCEWMLSFKHREKMMRQPDVFDGHNMFCQMAQGNMRWNLWLFLVRRSLYENNNIRFLAQADMGEDMMVMMKLSFFAKRVKICHIALYHYVQTNANSLTRKYENVIGQISENIKELESFILRNGREDLQQYIYLLQLTVKRPFLVSQQSNHYKLWREWFPEANKYLNLCTCRTNIRLLQRMALWKHDWFLRAYYWLVFRVVYGILYK